MPSLSISDEEPSPLRTAPLASRGTSMISGIVPLGSRKTSVISKMSNSGRTSSQSEDNLASPPLTPSDMVDEEYQKMFRKARKDFGDDYFELGLKEAMKRLEKFKWESLDSERKKCFELGLTTNTWVICPFCENEVNNLGEHLNFAHPMFFAKCAFCKLDFRWTFPDWHETAAGVEQHIRFKHPEEYLRASKKW